MNEKKLSRPLISLIVSIALIIVGIAGSFILQTNSGKTTIRNVTIESESGHTLAMDVYIPENATAMHACARYFCTAWRKQQQRRNAALLH